MTDKRLIDANALEKTLVHEYIMYNDANTILTLAGVQIFNSAIDVARSKIRESKTIDAVDVVHARWVHDDLGHTYCSKCHERLPYIHCYSEEPCSDYDEEWDEEMPESMYCPHCGAKMDGGAEC